MTTATQSRADELDLITTDLQEIYNYLDDLRKSGETNMYGAGPYIRDEFDYLDIGKRESHKILAAWMKDFSK